MEVAIEVLKGKSPEFLDAIEDAVDHLMQDEIAMFHGLIDDLVQEQGFTWPDEDEQYRRQLINCCSEIRRIWLSIPDSLEVGQPTSTQDPHFMHKVVAGIMLGTVIMAMVVYVFLTLLPVLLAPVQSQP